MKLKGFSYYNASVQNKDALIEAIQNNPYIPIPEGQSHSCGFINPIEGIEDLYIEKNNRLFFMVKISKKSINEKKLKEEVFKWMEGYQQNSEDGSEAPEELVQQKTEEIRQVMLQFAPEKHSIVFGFFDFNKEILILGTTVGSQADDVASMLIARRINQDDYTIKKARIENPLAPQFTGWIQNMHEPTGMQFGVRITISYPDKGKAVVQGRYSCTENIKNLIEEGSVTELGLCVDHSNHAGDSEGLITSFTWTEKNVFKHFELEVSPEFDVPEDLEEALKKQALFDLGARSILSAIDATQPFLAPPKQNTEAPEKELIAA